MRVTADRRLVEITPGSPAELNLEVVNTNDVIDGVSARIVGVDAHYVTAKPSLLPLFPDSSGQLTLNLGLPVTFPAGRHPVTVEIASHTGTSPPEHVDVDLDVAPFVRVEMRSHPAVQRVRRRGAFTLELDNRGNVPVDVALSCTDPDRALRTRFSSTSVNVAAGTTERVQLTVKGPRHVFGSELGRSLSVHAEALAAQAHRDTLGEHSSAGADATVTLRQRPLVPRGLLTALVLTAIVALWAGAFLLGLNKVFGGDPFTKAAPPSFFVSSSALKGLAAANIPGDVLAKGGPLPPGVGGVIAGRVNAASTGDGVGRIVVSAYRRSPDGLVLVTSSATQADGSYGVIGLFPGSYLLQFSAPGFHDVWYPAAASAGGATAVGVTPQQVARAKPVQITGTPANVIGRVDAGDAKHVRIEVIVRSLTGHSTKPVARTVTDAHGRYRLRHLPAPNSYQLSFVGPHYLANTVTEKLAAGQTRYEPLVRLSAGNGTISGVVTDGSKPLGGVSVSTNVDGQSFKTITPTQGAIGHFTLSGVPTPGTYVLTFARDAGTTATRVVRLGAGATRTINTPIELIGGTNAVSGIVTDGAGRPLGGATVTVGGTPTTITTTTITAVGALGRFTLSGLAAPGNYTLTATIAGYQPTTVPITLDGVSLLDNVKIPLQSALGGISGKVRKQTGAHDFAPAVGATVTATDGIHQRTTVAVDGGGFTVTNLVPGHYTVTASLDGFVQQTTIVDVVAGPAAPLPLPGDGWLTLEEASG